MKPAVYLCSILLLVAVLGCGGGGSSNPIATTTTPQIYQITPSSGYPGDLVTIRGANFEALGSYSTVTFNGILCQYTSWTDTVIYCYIPQSATTSGSFIVTSASGRASTPFTQFSLTSAQIISVSPSSGIPGTLVSIAGAGFGVSSATSRVTFNGIAATDVVWSPTYITCKIPYISQSGNVPLSIYIGSGNNPVYTFNYILPQMNVAAVSAGSTGNNVGAELAITGQGFGSSPSEYSAALSFGSIPVQFFSSWTANRIIFKIPSGVTGGSTNGITLTLNGRNYSSIGWYVGIPEIYDSSPDSVYAKDETITLNGRYLGLRESTSTIMFGGTQVQPTSWTDTSVSFKNPYSGVIGTQLKSVYVTVGGIQSNAVEIEIE